MVGKLDNRLSHYGLLALVWAVLCLPNLGGPSLWDIDEGNNAECAQEMYESGNFIVPTFNYKLRVDKPVLLYWLQASAYRVCGLNEFAARLPSALASLPALLVLYELGRRLFERSTALLAALMLAGSVAFCAAAHFANPDALLNLCTLLTLWCLWNHYTRRGWWLLGAGAACGLGMLAKGPVAVLLPAATMMLFCLVRREVRRWCDPRWLAAALMFLLVAAPWYIWVGVETKGEWLAGFFWKHNVARALGALENHSGPFYYYELVLIAGLMPWSVFLGPTIWHAALRYPPKTKHGWRKAIPPVLDRGMVGVFHPGADKAAQLHPSGVSGLGTVDGVVPRRLAARTPHLAGLGDANEYGMSGIGRRRRRRGNADCRRRAVAGAARPPLAGIGEGSLAGWDLFRRRGGLGLVWTKRTARRTDRLRGGNGHRLHRGAGDLGRQSGRSFQGAAASRAGAAGGSLAPRSAGGSAGLFSAELGLLLSARGALPGERRLRR